MEHCQENLLTYYTYHDKGREISTEELMKYDVIITSYSTCVIDYGKTPGAAGTSQPSKKKRKGFGSLYDIPWKASPPHHASHNLIAEQRCNPLARHT